MGEIIRTNTTLLIFAGGRATRLGGVNKALVPLGGRPLIEHVLERLGPAVSGVVVSANRDTASFVRPGVRVVADKETTFPGPLAALEAAADVVETEWVLTAPCDAPFLPADLLERFRARQAQLAREGFDPDAYMIRTENHKQGAVACVRTKRLAEARGSLAAGEHRLGRWYAALGAAEVPVFGMEEAFANLNTPEEISAAEAGCNKFSRTLDKFIFPRHN